MFYVRATADFAAKRMFFVTNRINLDRIAIFITEGSAGAFFEGLIGLFLFPSNGQVFGDLLVDDFFNFIQLLPCDFFRVGKIKAGTLGCYVAAALDDVVAQYVF